MHLLEAARDLHLKWFDSIGGKVPLDLVGRCRRVGFSRLMPTEILRMGETYKQGRRQQRYSALWLIHGVAGGLLRPLEGLGLDETIISATADGWLAGRVVSASKPDERGRPVPFCQREGQGWVADESSDAQTWRKHLDSTRSEHGKWFIQCSTKLLAVQGVRASCRRRLSRSPMR